MAAQAVTPVSLLLESFSSVAMPAERSTTNSRSSGVGVAWLDPDVQDDPVYAEHWAGHRTVSVSIEADRIVIRRAGEDAGSSNGDGPSDDSDD